MQFIIPWLTATLISFFATPIVILIAKKWGMVDDPRKRYHPAHTHQGVIPRAGGLAIFAGIIIAIFRFLPLSAPTMGIIYGALVLIVVGLIDDKHDINPYIRLGTNIVAACIVVFSGSSIPYITNPITGGVLSLHIWDVHMNLWGIAFTVGLPQILAVIWIVWTMNIIGWSAGVDGQMPGYVAIAAFTLGLLSLRYGVADPRQLWVTNLAFIITGAFLGFLPWNFYPQRIMPGYGGKTLAGYFLALLGILSFAKLGTAILVLGIPMLDAVATMVRRIGGKKSPVWADRGHLHHRLMDLGWGRRRIALFYWGVSGILGLVSLTVTSKLKVFAFIAVAVALTMFLVWVSFFTQFSKQRGRDNG